MRYIRRRNLVKAELLRLKNKDLHIEFEDIDGQRTVHIIEEDRSNLIQKEGSENGYR